MRVSLHVSRGLSALLCIAALVTWSRPLPAAEPIAATLPAVAAASRPTTAAIRVDSEQPSLDAPVKVRATLYGYRIAAVRTELRDAATGERAGMREYDIAVFRVASPAEWAGKDLEVWYASGRDQRSPGLDGDVFSFRVAPKFLLREVTGADGRKSAWPHAMEEDLDGFRKLFWPRIVVDRDRSAAYGVTALDIEKAIEAALEGAATPESYGAILIRTKDGKAIQLRDVATIRDVSGPGAGRLEFRIAVPAGGDKGGLSARAKAGFVGELAANGPTAKGAWAWMPIRGDPNQFQFLVKGDYKDRTYLLLANDPNSAMLAPRGPADGWGLRRVAVTTDASGRPAILVDFDGPGGDRLEALTSTHLGQPLAILVDGEVFSAPIVQSTIRSAAQITGHFTKTEAERLARAIRVGMAATSRPAESGDKGR